MIKGLYRFAQKWSENGSVWVYSDTHFDDTDTKIMDPNWIDPEKQIDILSSSAHKNDTLILLGDIGVPKYLKGIKAYKVLIAGNHDAGLSNYADYFDEMYGGPLFISDRILLSHEPIFLPFVFNIHGHDHNGRERENHLNVCANVVGYQPVNLGNEIKRGVLKGIPNIHRMVIDERYDP